MWLPTVSQGRVSPVCFWALLLGGVLLLGFLGVLWKSQAQEASFRKKTTSPALEENTVAEGLKPRESTLLGKAFFLLLLPAVALGGLGAVGYSGSYLGRSWGLTTVTLQSNPQALPGGSHRTWAYPSPEGRSLDPEEASDVEAVLGLKVLSSEPFKTFPPAGGDLKTPTGARASAIFVAQEEAVGGTPVLVAGKPRTGPCTYWLVGEPSARGQQYMVSCLGGFDKTTHFLLGTEGLAQARTVWLTPDVAH